MKPWIINEPLTPEQKEKLYIIALSKNIPVYELSLTHHHDDEYPYIEYSGDIHRLAYIRATMEGERITYKEAISKILQYGILDNK